MAGNKNSGRRPQPTKLKVLRGNPSKTKLNPHEPKPPNGPVVRPAHLSALGRVTWDELAPMCVAMGTLTVADTAAFAKLCELEATAREASRQKDLPEFRMFSKFGAHAAIRLERDTSIALRPYYEKFGLEPAGRARISVLVQTQPESKWAGVLA